MSASRDLTLRRWLPVLCPEATRVPTGRVARVMTYYLAHCVGRHNARHWLDYVSEMEPDQLDRIRIGIALARRSKEREFSGREILMLRRRVRAALATARRRWNLPVRPTGDERFYIDLAATEETAPPSGSPSTYQSANEAARSRWGGAAIIVSAGERQGP